MPETITTCFPTDLYVQYDYVESTDHSTVVEPLYDGSSQRRGMYPTAGRKDAVFSLNFLSQTDRQRVDSFLAARRGQLEPWYFFLPDTDRIYLAENVGSASGSAGQVIALPFRQSSIQAVYVNGTSIGAGYSFTPNVGTFGEDQLTITGSYTLGQAITVDITGRKRFGVRATSDKMQWKPVQDSVPLLWGISIPIIEV